MIAFAFATFHAPKKASLAEKTFDSPHTQDTRDTRDAKDTQDNFTDVGVVC